jgi:hypothetical protein
MLGVVLWDGGKPDEAEAVFRAGLAQNPSNRPLRMNLFALRLLSGHPDEAIQILEAAHDTDSLNRLLAQATHDPAARRRLLAGLGKFTPPLTAFDRARIYGILGDWDRCLAELATSVRNRDPRLEFIKTDPTWVPMHGDPRFARLVQEMGLPP